MGAGCSIVGNGPPRGVEKVTAVSQDAPVGEQPSFPRNGTPTGPAERRPSVETTRRTYPRGMGRRLALVLLALLLTGACGVPAPGPGAPAAVDVAGSWNGHLELPGMPLDLGVTLTGSPGALTGTLDVPTQGVRAMPLADITADGGTIRFTVPELPGNASFAGTLAADGSAIGGRFTQNGTEFPLVLRRGAVAAPARPQEPQSPFPYRSEDVTYAGGAGNLAGTLTLPDGAGPFPAVLLIAGSGAQDRDENVAGHRPFLLLADALTRLGTAVLRVDDRGVGGSAGSIADAR